MKIITTNKIAKFKYELLDKFEAGIVLQGTEVKSIRNGNVELKESFITITNKAEAELLNAHIAIYKEGNIHNHDPVRTRKLLLNKKEILKIKDAKERDGLTCVPYKMYINDQGKVKLEIYIARGKKTYDKRQSIKERDEKRYQSRQMSKKW